MNTDNLLSLMPYIAPIITAFAGIRWGGVILDKLNIKQKRGDVESDSLRNLKRNLELYQEIVDDLNQKYKERIFDFEENFNQSLIRLKLELEDLRSVNDGLQQIIIEQRALIVRQSKSIKYYESKCNQE